MIFDDVLRARQNECGGVAASLRIAEYTMKGTEMEGPSKDQELLNAAQLLLDDVVKQRFALSRREQDLKEQVAMLKARLNGRAAVVASVASEDDEGEHIGPTAATEELYRMEARRLNAHDVARYLETQKILIKAKDYLRSARQTIRRLEKKGTIKKNGPPGYYKYSQKGEAQLS